jgi:thiamine-phosphate pyrophosphorylase
MMRRQTDARCWLVANRQPDAEFWRAVRRLPRGSGVLLLCEFDRADRLHLRHLARLRSLTVHAEAPRRAIRAHNIGVLRGALLVRTPLILLSPIAWTASHPDWEPLPRMRAAALARLADRRLVALGGMDPRRYARIARLGFIGWAGISAFRT